MWRLTRQVRLAVNFVPDGQLGAQPSNSHAGFPSSCGFGQYVALDVTLAGELDPASSYLRNIKEVDRIVRERALGPISTAVRAAANGQDAGNVPQLANELFALLQEAWGGSLSEMGLRLTPFLCVSIRASEYPMTVRLSQKFEFSASHRLFRQDLKDDENYNIYGKCSNPNGHGHNYELQVTVDGSIDHITQRLVSLPALERIVGETVISRLDHKNLNLDVPEFAQVIPSVENIARVIYRLLAPALAEGGTRLASVTVWETPKTWCEYSE